MPLGLGNDRTRGGKQEGEGKYGQDLRRATLLDLRGACRLAFKEDKDWDQEQRGGEDREYDAKEDVQAGA